jgi:hypothetical protein
MDDGPKKRRGPLLWLEGRSRWFWIFVAVMMPVLYPLSWGPALFAFHKLGEPIWLATPLARWAPLAPEWIFKPYRTYMDWWFVL